MLRPGGMFVFDIATPIIGIAWSERRRATEPHRTGAVLRPGPNRLPRRDGDSVEWQLTYGQWIRLFRANGFAIEDLIELRPEPEATSTYDLAPLEWARDYPGEHIWKVRKA